MNDNDIADLRAVSLDGLLIAARRRRKHRRTMAVCGVAVALATVAIVLDLGRHRDHRSAISGVTVGLTPHPDQKPAYVVRTTSGSLVRISSNAKASSVRVKTSPLADVPRIDTSTLADFFPGRGIAVIHNDTEPARAVFF